LRRFWLTGYAPEVIDTEAYYGRPEALLDPAARLSCSAWSFVGAAVHDRFGRDLSHDLADGTWDRRHGHLRTQPAFDGSLIVVVSPPKATRPAGYSKPDVSPAP
jgi:hypothetical protein